MSEIDRVFARLGGGQPSGTDQRERRTVPRKGSAAGLRVVEVVRLSPKGSQGAAATPRRTDHGLRAATWDDGFPARPAAQAPAPDQPRATDMAEPVVHLMPAWARPATEPVPAPTTPAAAAERPRSPGRPRRAPAVSARRVADPFDPADDGANCLRCGYAVEPARERRGLLTCARCG